jgi:hypothetical protein
MSAKQVSKQTERLSMSAEHYGNNMEKFHKCVVNFIRKVPENTLTLMASAIDGFKSTVIEFLTDQIMKDAPKRFERVRKKLDAEDSDEEDSETKFPDPSSSVGEWGSDTCESVSDTCEVADVFDIISGYQDLDNSLQEENAKLRKENKKLRIMLEQLKSKDFPILGNCHRQSSLFPAWSTPPTTSSCSTPKLVQQPVVEEKQENKKPLNVYKSTSYTWFFLILLGGYSRKDIEINDTWFRSEEHNDQEPVAWRYKLSGPYINYTTSAVPKYQHSIKKTDNPRDPDKWIHYKLNEKGERTKFANRFEFEKHLIASL